MLQYPSRKEVLTSRPLGSRHEILYSHEMRRPAGTRRGGVSMAFGWQGRGAGKGEGVKGHRLTSPPSFFRIAYSFLFPISMM